MNKNPLNKERVPGQDEENKQQQGRGTRDLDKQQQHEQHHQSEPMGKKQRGQKFTSDEDIVKGKRTA